jgi:lysophospholipid acyltransferase (LPLAT)-like uncharacterized protein
LLNRRKKIKNFIKKSDTVASFVALLIYLYLHFVYLTTKWVFIYPEGYDKKLLLNRQRVLFLLWHNRIAFGAKIFTKYRDICALVSPHSDGRILIKLLGLFGHEIVEGSSNKNPTIALKKIIAKLSAGGRAVITPDGPRGPVYKINGSITKIALKYGAEVIPVSCAATSCFRLKSWDGMIIPKPFGKALVLFGPPVKLTGDETEDKILLEKTLNDLTALADNKSL